MGENIGFNNLRNEIGIAGLAVMCDSAGGAFAFVEGQFSDTEILDLESKGVYKIKSVVNRESGGEQIRLGVIIDTEKYSFKEAEEFFTREDLVPWENYARGDLSREEFQGLFAGLKVELIKKNDSGEDDVELPEIIVGYVPPPTSPEDRLEYVSAVVEQLKNCKSEEAFAVLQLNAYGARVDQSKEHMLGKIIDSYKIHMIPPFILANLRRDVFKWFKIINKPHLVELESVSESVKEKGFELIMASREDLSSMYILNSMPLLKNLPLAVKMFMSPEYYSNVVIAKEGSGTGIETVGKSGPDNFPISRVS